MNQNYLSVCLSCSVALTSSLSAATHDVSTADELQAAWTAAAPGDTIVLHHHIDVASIDWGDDKGGIVTLTSAEGNRFGLTWSTVGADAALPARMKLEHVQIAGSPGVALRGDELAVGKNNLWQNNAGAVTAGQTLTIETGNRWESNTRRGNGGAIHVEAEATARIEGGNVFENNHAVGGGTTSGSGGAIRLENGAVLTLHASKAGENILFSNNTEGASLDNGTLTPGTANDLSLAAGSKVEVEAVSGSSVRLQGGLSSDDATAAVTKKGKGTLALGESSWYTGSLTVEEGAVVLLEKAVYGDGTASAPVELKPGASFALGAGSVLNAPLRMEGASLFVSGNASVLSDQVTLTGNNVWSLQPGNTQLANNTTLLSLAPGTRIEQTDTGTLTLNLDLRGLTSFGNATELNVVNLADLADEGTKKLLSGASVSVTDAAGTRASGEQLDAMTGSLNLADLLASVRFDRPGTAAANALWSSTGALQTFAGQVRHQRPLPGAAIAGNGVWVSGLGYFDEISAAYRFSGGGYALGASTALGRGGSVGLAFGQIIGDNKARLDSPVSDASAKTDQNEIMIGLYGNHGGKISVKNAWAIDWIGAYGRTDNELSAPNYRGDWTDNNFYAAARFSWQYKQEDGTCIAPFIGLEWLHGSQDAAQFTGASHWRIDGADLSVLSLPVGLSIYRSMEAGNGKIFTPQLDILYRGDLVQEAPESTATDGYANWQNKAHRPGRNALEVRARLHLQITPAWSGYLGGSVEARSDRTTTRVSAGVNYAF